MDERLRFLARILDGEPMTDVCRDFGISRKTGYKIDASMVVCAVHQHPNHCYFFCCANLGWPAAPDPFSNSFVTDIQQAGQATGTPIIPIMIQSAQELDAAFQSMEGDRPDAVIVQPSLPTKRVADLALTCGIPAVCTFREFAYEGGLMAYFTVEADMYRRAADLVNKILNGAKPANLPVEQPDRFELVINLKTAKVLGLTFPQSLLLRAGEVVE